MTMLFEVVKKRLAHPESPPFMLLFNKRHIDDGRVAVEGY